MSDSSDDMEFYFAAMAMQGMLAYHEYATWSVDEAVDAADRLIVELAKKDGV